MVKRQRRDSTETPVNKGENEQQLEARKINASTPYETCREPLSAFGGVLALIKFLDLVEMEKIIESCYTKPERETKLGHYKMLIGILVLLFVGFNRIGHFFYIRYDALVCRFFQVVCLPVVSTFWRYVNSMGLNQGSSLLRVISVLRERAWQQCGIVYEQIDVDIDTTVETVYGEQQGARVGHNPRNRGKKGYRPIVAFIAQTREYIAGKLRKGATVSGEETARFTEQISRQLPGCVKRVLVRADSEFFSWESIKALMELCWDFIISAKSCNPPFDPQGWYCPVKAEAIEYNECVYAPIGWQKAMRFVAMRIPKHTEEKGKAVQLELFEDDRYKYRMFCTSRRGRPHSVIAEYDKRADVENLIGEAKREGLEAIPSKKFKNNYAWFQLVMLSYNIWRYIKMLAEKSSAGQQQTKTDTASDGFQDIVDNTIRIARLKLLYLAAKTPFHNNHTTVKYSVHDMRTPGLMRLLSFLDEARSKAKAWLNGGWRCRFTLNTA
jgi:hypothetical protein